MNSSSDHKKYLDKILKSKEFAGSKIHKSYLSYLVEASLQGKALKETTIALEFFGKDASFDPAEDTIVRSHTYNLRKKLEGYYYTEGKEDKCRLRIPKGHYEVEFIPESEYEAPTKTNILDRIDRRYYVLALAVLCIALVALAIRNLALERSLQEFHLVDRSDPIWSDYLESDLPILIAIGDHFVFNDFNNEYENLIGIRHGKINSPEDLELLKAKYPNKNLQASDEPYFPYHSIWSLPPILALFSSAKQQPILRKCSSLNPQMLDEYNMIFVGSLKTLFVLKHILAKSHFQFEISPHKIRYTPPDSSAAQLFEASLHSSGPNNDLVLALKLPGPERNSIFIIASFHSLGAPAVAKYLTDASTRIDLEQRFREKCGRMPRYFEVLLRVTGIDKTAYKTEILVMDEISAE